MTMTKEHHKITVNLFAPLTEFSPEFVQGMGSRMTVSFFKYGRVADGFPERIDALACMLAHVQEYQQTGNTEKLIDAANYLMIEFMHPRHPLAFFKATDSDGSLGRVTTGGETTHRANDLVDEDGTPLRDDGPDDSWAGD